MKYSRGFAFQFVIGTLLVCWTLTAAVAQTYTATQLLPPPGYIFLNLDGTMNNHNQVLGEVGPLQRRAPVLWTNGVPQILPIPSEYAYIAELYTYKVNDAGTVIGTVQEANRTNQHILIWKDGVPTRLQEIQKEICPNPKNPIVDDPATYSTGLNSAGHIVGTTTYPPVDHNNGQPCTASWFWDGATFTPLPNPIPSQCGANQTSTTLFPILNDADVVVENVMNYFCSNWQYDNDPVEMYPPTFTTYSFLDLGSFKGLSAGYINNLGMISGCISCGNPAQVGVWDPINGLRGLGANTGYGSMNNIGQVVYVQNPANNPQVRMWLNGTSVPIQLPPGVPHTALPMAFTDTGQIAVQDAGTAAYLLTPAVLCPTCR